MPSFTKNDFARPELRRLLSSEVRGQITSAGCRRAIGRAGIEDNDLADCSRPWIRISEIGFLVQQMMNEESGSFDSMKCALQDVRAKWVALRLLLRIT